MASHPHRWRTLAVTMSGYGLVQMGMVPVSATMPTLGQELGVPLRVASWLLTGCLLAMTALILPAGRLGDRYGHKRVFLGGLAAFTATCALVRLVGSFWPFLFLRLIQGGASAFVIGTAMAWVTNSFPAGQRGRVVGAVTLASFIGGLASLNLGSWAIQHATWHWIFLVLVPPGALALAAGVGIPEERPRRPQGQPPLDWAGVAVLAVALTAFSLGLTHLHEGTESWADGWQWHLPMHLLFLLSAALFIAIERRAPEPILPLPLLGNRAFLAALGANLVLHMTMMGFMSMAPFLIQIGLGLTPSHTAGTLMMVQGLSLAMSPVSGWLYDRADSRLLLPGSMAVVGSGLFLCGLFTTSLGFPALLALGLYLGTGMGLFLSANNAALMGAVPAGARGFASGMLETTRQLGHGLGTTAVGTLLSYGVSLAGSGGGQAALRSGFRAAYWLMALLACAGVLCAMGYIRVRRRERGSLPAGAAD